MYFSGNVLFPLQNGSDIRGVAMEGENEVNLTPEIVRTIGASFGRWVAQKTGKTCDKLKIGVGSDSRVTGKTLKKAFLDGVLSVGAKGFDCSMASTPAMFMSTVFPKAEFDGSCMVTASHMPKDRNGLKFFTREGGLEKEDIKLILTNAIGQEPKIAVADFETFDLMTLYCEHLKKLIINGVGEDDKPLKGLKIVTDAGNGAGGFYAQRVLEPLGADIEGSLYLEPDGSFPNHVPNPEDKEAMAAIVKATVENKADLGLIFDTDVDRASAVLEDGTPAAKDNLIALLASLIREQTPHCTIVTDSVTSDRLTDFLNNELKITHHRFKRGYRNVINEAISLNEKGVFVPLAIETSGHGAFKDNFFLDDGAYIATKLVIALARAKKNKKSLESYIEKMAPAYESFEARMKITRKDYKEYGDQVLAAFKENAQKAGIKVVTPSYEGVRLSFPNGWLLLRKSLHEPLLPLNAEGTEEGALREIVLTASNLLKEFKDLDLSALKR